MKRKFLYIAWIRGEWLNEEHVREQKARTFYLRSSSLLEARNTVLKILLADRKTWNSVFVIKNGKFARRRSFKVEEYEHLKSKTYSRVWDIHFDGPIPGLSAKTVPGLSSRPTPRGRINVIGRNEHEKTVSLQYLDS